jgi:23S rRNA pseudouridine1911/1915/1917 synthase
LSANIERLILEVKEKDNLSRLDLFLASNTSFSRSRIKKIILEGGLTYQGSVIKDLSKKVKTGEEYIIDVPPPESSELIPLNKNLDIVYEDNHLIVLNKPANLTVHPGAGNYQDTLVNVLLHHAGKSLSGIGGVVRPGIVHRLDKDTTGLMVIAKNDDAHISLSEQIKTRELKRIYNAVVWGKVFPPEGIINANIGRSTIDRKKMAILRGSGREAITHYKLIKYFSIASLIECKLETGRTHQIRIHMTNLGYPIIGDQTYGKAKDRLLADISDNDKEFIKNFPRQALHSKFIEFLHPASGKTLSFETELPADMQTLMSILEKIEL